MVCADSYVHVKHSEDGLYGTWISGDQTVENQSFNDQPEGILTYWCHWNAFRCQAIVSKQKCARPWDRTPHPPVLSNELGSWDFVSKMSEPWDGLHTPIYFNIPEGVGFYPRVQIICGTESRDLNVFHSTWGCGTLSQVSGYFWDRVPRPQFISMSQKVWGSIPGFRSFVGKSSKILMCFIQPEVSGHFWDKVPRPWSISISQRV